MRPRTASLLAALALATASASANDAQPFPAPLTLAGPGPYYTLRIPMALQSAARRDDLGDLRVRNASGDTLPYAWLPERTESEEPQQAAATLYKVPVPAAAAASAKETIPPQAWIVDTHDPGFSLERLVLTLAPGTQGVFALRVDASDDLQRWRPVQPAAQLVQLAPPPGAGSTAPLLATEIELGDVPARYLRLSTAAGKTAPGLDGAIVLRSRHRVLESTVEWSPVIAPASCDGQHCDYVLPRNVPLEQLQVMLAEPDTVGQLTVLAKVDAAAMPVRRHHLLRGSLRAIRAKDRASSPDANWAWLASTNVYWLRNVGGVAELRSPPLRLDAGQTPMLRLQASGTLRQLGHAPPTLRIGAHVPTLVFLARAPAPFRLELAAAEDPSPAMHLAQLMPARRPEDPLPVDTATPAVVAIAAATASAAALASPPPARTDAPWLWAALLGGVGLMGVMAWTLLRKRPG